MEGRIDTASTHGQDHTWVPSRRGYPATISQAGFLQVPFKILLMGWWTHSIATYMAIHPTISIIPFQGIGSVWITSCFSSLSYCRLPPYPDFFSSVSLVVYSPMMALHSEYHPFWELPDSGPSFHISSHSWIKRGQWKVMSATKNSKVLPGLGFDSAGSGTPGMELCWGRLKFIVFSKLSIVKKQSV